MQAKVYEAFWHRNFKVSGIVDGEIIDSVGERSYSKSEIIKLAKKEFKKLYSNKQAYEKMCKDNDALSIDISIECFLIEYDGGKVIKPEDLCCAKGYEEQWDSYLTSIDKSNYKTRI
jgi:hypothetical protein